MSRKPSKRRRATPKQAAAGRKNLLAFREAAGAPPAMKHGATTAEARRGELPAGFEHLQPVIDHFWDGWISDLGGRDTISRQKEALLFSARVCLVFILLTLEHVKRDGFTDAKGRPQPVLGIVGTAINSLRLNLTACGLERQARNVTPQTLEAYLREKAEKADSDAQTASVR